MKKGISSKGKPHGLSPSEQKKTLKIYGLGKNQEDTAKDVGVAKWRVSNFLQAEKKSRKQPSGFKAFNADVRVVMDTLGVSRKEGFRLVGQGETWGRKRAAKIVWYTKEPVTGKKIRHVGKKWKSTEERLKTMAALKKKWRSLIKKGEGTEDEYGNVRGKETEEYMYGDSG